MEAIQLTKSKIASGVVPLTFLLVGCVLIVFGAQRIVASFILAPVNPTISLIEERQPVDDADLDQLITTQRKSLSVFDDPRGWSNLGMAYALKAAHAPSDASERSSLFAEAQISLQHSILAAPANPYVWLRLATIQEQRRENVELTLRYMDLSVMSGPNEPDLYLSRIAIGISYWPYLVASEREALFKQMRQSYHYDRWPFINLIVGMKAVNIARAALIVDRKDFAEFESMIPH